MNFKKRRFNYVFFFLVFSSFPIAVISVPIISMMDGIYLLVIADLSFSVE